MVNDAAKTRSESAKHLPVIYMLFACISLYLMLNPNLTLTYQRQLEYYEIQMKKLVKLYSYVYKYNFNLTFG